MSKQGRIFRGRKQKSIRMEALQGVYVELLAHSIKPEWVTFCRCVITRFSPRQLDAHDNLPTACKRVVDGVADALGRKDNDPMFEWNYRQSKDVPWPKFLDELKFGVEIYLELKLNRV